MIDSVVGMRTHARPLQRTCRDFPLSGAGREETSSCSAQGVVSLELLVGVQFLGVPYCTEAANSGEIAEGIGTFYRKEFGPPPAQRGGGGADFHSHSPPGEPQTL